MSSSPRKAKMVTTWEGKFVATDLEMLLRERV